MMHCTYGAGQLHAKTRWKQPSQIVLAKPSCARLKIVWEPVLEFADKRGS